MIVAATMLSSIVGKKKAWTQDNKPIKKQPLKEMILNETQSHFIVYRVGHRKYPNEFDHNFMPEFGWKFGKGLYFSTDPDIHAGYSFSGGMWQASFIYEVRPQNLLVLTSNDLEGLQDVEGTEENKLTVTEYGAKKLGLQIGQEITSWDLKYPENVDCVYLPQNRELMIPQHSSLRPIPHLLQITIDRHAEDQAKRIAKELGVTTYRLTRVPGSGIMSDKARQHLLNIPNFDWTQKAWVITVPSNKADLATKLLRQEFHNTENKQPLKEQGPRWEYKPSGGTGVCGFINPDGQFYNTAECDLKNTHSELATKLIDKLDIQHSQYKLSDSDEYSITHSNIFELLKRGWIRISGNNFQTYRLTRNEKDLIFMFAKEHKLNEIWVEETRDNEWGRVVLTNQPPEALYEQRILARNWHDYDHSCSFIDADGEEHIVGYEQHLEFAEKFLDPMDDRNSIIRLLIKGWIRKCGNSFETYRKPTGKQRDIIFMISKREKYGLIYVDTIQDGPVLTNDEPEALYESRSLLERINQLSYYHGTDIKILPSILKSGLIPNGSPSTKGRHQKAVYLTPSFETAARYAIGLGTDQIPVVVEFVISKEKRIKKIQYDPMDRPESTWDEDGGGMGGGPEDDSIREIEHGIENILKKLGKKDTRYSINLRDYGFDDDEISSFDGVNIYKVVTSTIMKKYDPWIAGVKISRNDVLKAVREEFKPGQLAEYFEIRDDGTLKLTQDYYQSKDQYLYPKNIPPVAIKFIWVRVDDFKIDRSRYVEFKKAGAKELPGESKEKINRIREILTNLGGALEEMIEDDDDLIEIREELEGYGETEAAELIQSYLNLSKEEREDKTKEYREKFYEMEGYVLEDWGEEKVTGDWEWGKLPSARANMLFGDPKQLSLFERILSESSHVDIIVRNFEQALVEEFPQLERLHIHYRKSNNSLYFAEIKIKKEFRGQGIGSKVLKKINQFADDQNLTVTLIPEPEPRHKADLLKFYKSHDFVQNKGGTEIIALVIRSLLQCIENQKNHLKK